MIEDMKFDNLSLRQTTVEGMIDVLNGCDSFSSKLAARSLDFHLSDIRNQQEESLELQHQKEVLELRLVGTSVNSGSAPIELVSKLLKELALSVHRAANKIVTGKDSTKTANAIKDMLNLRFAGTVPGSTRVMMTANSVGDLAGNITHDTFEQLFDILESSDEADFIEHASNIGSHSLASVHGLISNINKQGLSFKLSWPDAVNGKIREWDGSRRNLESFQERFTSIDIRSTETARVSGMITVISRHGKLHVQLDDGQEIKSVFSPELLPQIEALNIGSRLTAEFQKIRIGNSKLDVEKISYRLMSIS
ncbi:conserved hypothetical protein [Vibrio chagasii]|nr:conserved hypothetical protein [Vibrio chagasii]CAH6851247.1 conserved hypothetical protein [Vibrio chagasii]CAH7175253.1 conserved hypothetical protein [Vibrio chagasii]